MRSKVRPLASQDDEVRRILSQEVEKVNPPREGAKGILASKTDRDTLRRHPARQEQVYGKHVGQNWMQIPSRSGSVLGANQQPEYHAAVKRAASIAAEALDQPAPEIRELPDGLPTAAEVDGLLAIMSGRHGGFSYLGNAGRAHKAEAFARKLK